MSAIREEPIDVFVKEDPESEEDDPKDEDWINVQSPVTMRWV